jgi:hypothetical protein
MSCKPLGIPLRPRNSSFCAASCREVFDIRPRSRISPLEPERLSGSLLTHVAASSNALFHIHAIDPRPALDCSTCKRIFSEGGMCLPAQDMIGGFSLDFS